MNRAPASSQLAELAQRSLLAVFFLVNACRGGVDSRRMPKERSESSAIRQPIGPSPRATHETGRALHTTKPEAWPRIPATVETDWCITGLSALDEETCYVLPRTPTETLLIYLHGIVPPGKTSIQKTNFETVVANASRRAGIAALTPRGRVGFAPRAQALWWGWPTTASGYRTHGAELVAGLKTKRKKLEDALGTSFSRLFIAGSSSGAYFVAALALHGGIDADGFGAMSGGAGSETTELTRLTPKPFYIGYGKYDSVAASAQSLGQVLQRAGWPVRLAEHAVGHGANEIYLDEAIVFWREHLSE